jgi:molecular chaperone IbpA
LTITGKIEGDTEGSEYLYKGIADRAFTRKFVLADTMEIKNAELINGMLKVYLENLIPENKKPRKVSINDEPTDPVSTVASWFSPKEQKEVA